jgi:hypothetical protein
MAKRGKPSVFQSVLSSKAFLISAAVLLIALISLGGYAHRARRLTPNPGSYAQTLIYLQHSHNEQVQRVHYYLMPAPPEQVRDALKDSLQADGYQWIDDSAPLWSMDSSWVDISMRHRPEVALALQHKAAATAQPLLDEALSQGLLTADEKAHFEESFRGQNEFEDDALKELPFFAQQIGRWRFSHMRNDHFARYAQEGGVMDVSPMFNRTPMTLVWFAGSKTIVRYEPHLFGCMTGVACFPSPGIDNREESVEYIDAGFDSRLHAIATKMHAFQASESDARMHVLIRDLPVAQKTVAIRDTATAPSASMAIYDLPADEEDQRRYDDDTWRLLPLPDGSVLAAGAHSRRYAVQNGAVVHTDEPPRYIGRAGPRVDVHGVVWGFNYAGDTTRLVTWSLGQNKAASTPLPMLGGDQLLDDWTLTPGGSVALLVGGKFYATSGKPGDLKSVIWNGHLRREATDSLEHTLPWLWSKTIHFNDGLFWWTDRDAYGVSPLTGKVVANIRTSVDSAFFGSRDAGWAVALANLPTGEGPVLRVIDLSTGLPRADWRTPGVSYMAGVARTAHGRLLAIGSTSPGVPATVFDMKAGEPLANLLPPQGYVVKAATFNWQGDKLWLYLEEEGAPSRRKLGVWSVPTQYIDASSPGAQPDQMRCQYPIDACKRDG